MNRENPTPNNLPENNNSNIVSEPVTGDDFSIPGQTGSEINHYSQSNHQASSTEEAPNYDMNNYRRSQHAQQANLNASTDRKMGETVARAADTYFTGGSVGAAVDTAEKVDPTGTVSKAKNELFDQVGKPVGQAVDTVDKAAGTDLRGVANDANKSGALDTVNSGLAAAGGAAGGASGATGATGGANAATGATGGANLSNAAANAGGARPSVVPQTADANNMGTIDTDVTPELDTSLTKEQQDVFNEVPEVGTQKEDEEENGTAKKSALSGILKVFFLPLKIWLAIGALGLFLMFAVLMIIMGPTLGAMADLTSGGTDGPGGVLGNDGTWQEMFTNEQIENQMIYVGDSRILGVQSALGNPNIRFIGRGGADYNWFIAEGRPQLEELLRNENRRFVVIALGSHDITNASRYITVFHTLVSSFPEVSFYFLSVNPVDEALAAQNNYPLTNSQIEWFNRSMSAALGTSFINSFNAMLNLFQSDDGFHFDSGTNRRLHEIIIGHIRRDNMVTMDSSNLVQLAIASTWPTRDRGTHARCTAYANCGMQQSTDGYRQARIIAEQRTSADGIRNLFSSCDRFVATMLRATGVDPNFPWGYTGTQWNYLNQSPNWERVSCQNRQAGDVVITQGRGHIVLYLGVIEGQSTFADASYMTRTGTRDTNMSCQGDLWRVSSRSGMVGFRRVGSN